MVDRDVTILEEISEQLEEQGNHEMASKVSRVIRRLRQASREARKEAGTKELITTGEAARELGVGSVNTVKRWAARGLLTGFRRGNRIMVTRESVAKMLDSPEVAKQKSLETWIDEGIEPFYEGPDETPLPTPWPGRKPWNSGKKSTA